MPERSTMNVSLTSELVDYVGNRVRSGRYGSASEVIRAGLRLLQREEPGNTSAVLKDVRQMPAAPDGHG